MELKVNKETRNLEVYINDVLVKTLDQEEAQEFFKKAKETEVDCVPFYKKDWIKITIDDILKEAEHIDTINDVIGINFDLLKYVRCFPEAHAKVSVKTTKPNEYDRVWTRVYKYLDSNFTDEQLYFGPITNHFLRSCLSEELLEYIMDKSGFEIRINDDIESIYRFFDEEKTYYYESDISTDT